MQTTKGHPMGGIAATGVVAVTSSGETKTRGRIMPKSFNLIGTSALLGASTRYRQHHQTNVVGRDPWSHVSKIGGGDINASFYSMKKIGGGDISAISTV